MYANQLSSRAKRPKKMHIAIVVVWVVLVIAVLFVLYWWAIHPIIARFISHEEDIYWDLSYYTKDNYLDFEHGTDFQKMLQEHDVDNKGIPIDFYYIDNRIEDNPIHGKQIDIYILEIQMQADTYQQEKNLIEASCSTRQGLRDFMLYALPFDSKVDTNVSVVAFCDINQTVRYILITDSDACGFPAIYQQLLRWTVMPWEAPS